MTKKKEKTYSVEEVRESMGQYLDSSIARLRLRLKIAWKKQTSTKQPFYDKVGI
jgi:hypothetical protein